MKGIDIRSIVKRKSEMVNLSGPACVASARAPQPHFAALSLQPFRQQMLIVVDCPQSMKDKILSPEKLLGVRHDLRADGRSLVFTNGVFDLLHVGHVRYLAA